MSQQTWNVTRDVWMIFIMLHMQNLQNVCIANHFLLENLWKNILLNCLGSRTLTTHLRAYVLSTKVKKPWKQKTKIRVYGESFFDDRVVVDENLNSHKISKPNALHLIYVSLFPSNFYFVLHHANTCNLALDNGSSTPPFLSFIKHPFHTLFKKPKKNLHISQKIIQSFARFASTPQDQDLVGRFWKYFSLPKRSKQIPETWCIRRTEGERERGRPYTPTKDL